MANTNPLLNPEDERAQPGDVLGIESGGETTHLGETREDERERLEETLDDVKDRELDKDRIIDDRPRRPAAGRTMPVLAMLLAGGLTVACGSREPDYEEMAQRALDASGLDVSADLEGEGSNRVLHVTGTVPTEADRQKAGDMARAAVGDGAQIANEVTVAGGHEQTAADFDDAIEERLESLVALDQTLKEHSISFDAENGVVTITGKVPTMALKERVGTMARTDGVRDVVNSLDVGA